MKNRSTRDRSYFAAGLFAVLSVAMIASAVLLYAGQRRWWRAGDYVVRAHFDQAPNVRPGTPAMVGGVTVGRVRDVHFADEESFSGDVVVDIALDGKRRLRRGAWARVVLPVGTGRATIEIDPGPSGEPLLDSGSDINGEVSSGFASLLPPEFMRTLEKTTSQFGTASDSLAPVLDDVHRMLAPMSLEERNRPGAAPGNLASAVARLDAALSGINRVLADADVQARLIEAIDNVHAGSLEGRQLLGEAESLMGDARTAVDRFQNLMTRAEATVSNVDTAAQKLSQAADATASMMSQMNLIVSRINSGQGSLGKLVNDDRLYEAMLSAYQRSSGQRP